MPLSTREIPGASGRVQRFVESHASESPQEHEQAFIEIYERWFGDVVRWLRAFGAPQSEMEDWAQEVFLVVRAKVSTFDGRNVRAWLYKIAQQTASDHRRRSWFRNMFLRPRDVELDEIRDLHRGPAELLEDKQARRIVLHLLEKMSPKRRTAFVLFELEGYSGEEISALEGIPVATVWTRIHHAHKEFLRRLQELQTAERP